jgi:hypothetical protein
VLTCTSPDFSRCRASIETSACSRSAAVRAVVFVNSLVLQDVLAEPGWSTPLTADDRRGPSPLFWQHVYPYGEITLDLASRLTIGRTTGS